MVWRWAILPPITVLFITTSCTAVWGPDNLVQALLVHGYVAHHLLVGVEDPLGPLGGLTGHSLCDCLGQCQVLLGKEVLLQLHVAHPVDEQAKNDGLAVVELGLARHIAAGEQVVHERPAQQEA